MTRIVSVQTNFSSGEIDPLLRARVDINQYQNGAERLENVLVQPQGGVRRRPGLRHLYKIPLTSAPDLGTRLVPFEFSVNDRYMLVFTDRQMRVIKNKTLITNINGSGLDYLPISVLPSSVLSTMCWTQSADTLIITHPDMQPIKIVRGASDSSWTEDVITYGSVPYYAFNIVTSNPGANLTPSAVSGSITLTASAAVFDAGYINQYINVEPQGRCRVVSYISTTKVEAVTEVPLFSTDPITSGKWEYESGYESVWSLTRGYPRTCTFHEGRLYFGGSRSRPSTIWGSKVGLFFDFQPDQAYDDDAVEATLDTNSLNVITDILSGRDLQVFTTGGEFYVPQQGLEPITPANFFVRAVSRNGSREGIRVQQLQSGTLYVQRQGKALNEFQYSDTTLSYISTSISLLSGHLINDPIELALRKSTSTEESDTLFMLNGDGTIAVYSILRQQNVVAPSRFVTSGSFKDIGVDLEDIYTVVKRRYGGQDNYFIEYFDSDTYTDGAFTGGAVSGVSGLPYYGAELNVIADGNVLSNETVSFPSDSITFDRPSIQRYEVGLPFDVVIKTLPAEPRLSVGVRSGFKKRILEVNAMLYQTQHLIINDVLIPIRTLDTALTLDQPTASFTGTKVVNGLLGYTQDAQITVSQNLPMKLTLLGLEYKMSVYGGT